MGARPSLELSGRRKDGSEFPVEITLSPLDTGQGQVVDTSGASQQANAETEVLFGYHRDELIGRPLETLVAERFHQAHAFHRGKYFQTPGERKMDFREMARLHKDGTEFPVDISLSFTGNDGDRSRPYASATSPIESVSSGVRGELRTGSQGRRRRRELLGHLVRAEEAERLRISSDIHDDSIQAMATAGLRLQQLRRRLTTATEIETLDKLDEAIEGSIDRLRHLMFELRPINVDRAGLAAALRAQPERIRSDAGLEFEVENRVTTEPPSATRFILYRIAMEALVNVRKHARAHRVQVRLPDVTTGGACRSTMMATVLTHRIADRFPGTLG